MPEYKKVKSQNKSHIIKLDNNIIIGNNLDSIKNEIKKLRSDIIISQNKYKIIKYISNESLFSISITIIIFALGILASQSIKYIDKCINKNQTRKFVKHHLDRIINSFCPKLTSEYCDLSNTTTIDSGIKITPPKILSNDFQRILHINSRELFNSIKKRRKNELSKIISEIDFLDSLISEVQIYHNHILERSDKLREQFNDKLNHYLKSLVNSSPNDEYYETMNTSVIKFYEDIAGKRELKKFYTDILRPNQEYLVLLNSNRKERIGIEIIEIGKDLTLLYNDLDELTNSFKKQYKEFACYINNSRISIALEIDKIVW